MFVCVCACICVNNITRLRANKKKIESESLRSSSSICQIDLKGLRSSFHSSHPNGPISTCQEQHLQAIKEGKEKTTPDLRHTSKWEPLNEYKHFCFVLFSLRGKYFPPIDDPTEAVWRSSDASEALFFSSIRFFPLRTIVYLRFIVWEARLTQ